MTKRASIGKVLLSAAALLAIDNHFVWAEDNKPPTVNPFIVGGKPVADIADTPWQIALVDAGSRSQFCGGALVSQTWVLTAAHCVDNWFVGMDPDRVDIVVGTLRFADGGEQIGVKAIHVHPDWDAGKLDFDAALLELDGPATLGKAVAMIRSEEDLPVGPRVRVTGWGATSEGGPGSNDLLFVEVPVVATEVCNKPESYGGQITGAMFCAGEREGGLDACQGDSGGPVDTIIADEQKVVGIVSWGHGCARKLKYGVYTRVSSVFDWGNALVTEN
jgi:secreted trypsin-like serine protease